jgi:hypothetical protein
MWTYLRGHARAFVCAVFQTQGHVDIIGGGSRYLAVDALAARKIGQMSLDNESRHPYQRPFAQGLAADLAADLEVPQLGAIIWEPRFTSEPNVIRFGGFLELLQVVRCDGHGGACGAEVILSAVLQCLGGVSRRASGIAALAVDRKSILLDGIEGECAGWGKGRNQATPASETLGRSLCSEYEGTHNKNSEHLSPDSMSVRDLPLDVKIGWSPSQPGHSVFMS